MNKPKIAGRQPVPVKLKQDEEHYWCSCGESNNQPFCDGTHKSTSFKPCAFKAMTSDEAYLCMCKHTKNPPYCDGTHNKLDE